MSGGSKESLSILGKACLTTMDKKLNILNEKVDKLLHFQEDITEKLQRMSQGMGHLQQGLHQLETSRGPSLVGDDSAPPADLPAGWPEALELRRAVWQDSDQYSSRLEALFRMVVAVDRASALVGSAFQNSKVVDFIMQGSVPWREGGLTDVLEENKEQVEEKGAKPKHALGTPGVQAATRGPWEENQKVDLPEGTVERLSRISTSGIEADHPTQAGTSPGLGDGIPGPGQVPPGHLLLFTEAYAKDPETSSRNPSTGVEWSFAPDRISEDPTSQEVAPRAGQKTQSNRPEIPSSEEGMRLTSGSSPQPTGPPGPPALARTAHSVEAAPRNPTHVHDMDAPREPPAIKRGILNSSPPAEAPAAAAAGEQHLPEPTCSPGVPGTEPGEQTPRGAGESALLQKRSGGGTVSEEKQQRGAEPTAGPSLARRDKRASAAGSLGLQQEEGAGGGPLDPGGLGRAEAGERSPPGAESGSMVLDDSPAPAAPFDHRVVSVKETSISAGYTVCQHEVLGGGRFGRVHRCTEKSTGLLLAAKIITVKNSKDREDVKNEVSIMNQLSHVNLIQLYDAFESKSSCTLVMEYVDGGELFDRITDEKYHLTELDVILFAKQICEGVRYLHQHYILHLDLKPENILCVSQTGHQIKIIDFGLARRYRPREKLKVNFGTPEFLAPEVVNYEFVSFPTDMWSIGVITYMLLSGLSPFLGETDAETMNFIVNCSWDFDADTFEGLSEEAKDFVSRLLVKEKSCRMSATQCLKHEWLNNLPAKASKSKVRLKSQLLLQKYMAQRKWKKHFYVVTAANRLRKFPTSP
ncbi:myosin light chain kinase 3 [Ctenodactylus gundi]